MLRLEVHGKYADADNACSGGPEGAAVRVTFPNAGAGVAPNLQLVAIPFIDELRAWHAAYVAQGGSR